jgi:ABC-type branched-subunit amino acid transport system ATPase component
VLDEPTEAIQPNVVAKIYQAISTLTATGDLSALFVEQHFGFAVERAGAYVVLASSRVAHRGPGGADATASARAALAI